MSSSHPILPPLRYVNADFRYYPIVLSAPGAAVKARLIANGSGVNLRGGARVWHDVGAQVTLPRRARTSSCSAVWPTA